MFPLMPLLGLAGGIFGGLSGASQARQDRELTREQLQQREWEAMMRTRLEESAMDPYRHQRAQAGGMMAMDRFARGTYTPVKLNLGQGGRLERTGGYDYTMPDDVRQALLLLRDSIMQGQTAPSVAQSSAGPGRVAQRGPNPYLAMDLMQSGGPTAAGGRAPNPERVADRRARRRA